MSEIDESCDISVLIFFDWVDDEVVSKSQELQREAYINISNIEQSA